MSALDLGERYAEVRQSKKRARYRESEYRVMRRGASTVGQTGETGDCRGEVVSL